MWWLVDLTISQTQQVPITTDPWALAGGGGALGLVMLLGGRIDKLIDAWSKRRNGGGHAEERERDAKETSRSMLSSIHKQQGEVTDAMLRIAQSQERTAEALNNVRRQDSDEHRDLANLIRDRR